MARIPYLPADLSEPSVLVDKIRARRGGHLLHLDRMLLHAPALAEGWNAFLGAVRTKLSLDGGLRELAILAVAVLNRADYEFSHHAPIWLDLGGRAEVLPVLQRLGEADFDATPFSAAERAVLDLTLAMTRAVEVRQPIFDRARDVLGTDQAMVELIGVIGAYNLVSRFLVALQIEPEGERG